MIQQFTTVFFFVIQLYILYYMNIIVDGANLHLPIHIKKYIIENVFASIVIFILFCTKIYTLI